MNPSPPSSLGDTVRRLLQEHSSGTVRLHLRQLGEIPSFKNKKRAGIGFRKNGTTFHRVWTPDEVKEWMERAIQSLQSQLRSEARMEGIEITTAEKRRSWIASCVPANDSRKWLKINFVEAVDVPPGEEGADITFYRIQ